MRVAAQLFLRHHPIVLSAVVASATATVVVALLPSMRFAYRAPALHVAIETAAALIACVAAFLVHGRYRREPTLRELLLVSALVLLAASNFLFAALPAALGEGPSRFSTWAGVGGHLLGSAVFAAASLAPTWRPPRPRWAERWALFVLAAALTAVALAVLAAGTRLPVGVETLPPSGSGRIDLDGHWVVLAVQLAATVFFAVAAIGFGRGFRLRGDDFFAWLAAGAVLAAFARLNYFLYPSLYSEWVYTGDVLRLLFYLVLLVAAGREVRRYWERLAQAAVVEERRRLARDLHDGAAQELSFILRRLRRLAERDEELAPVAAAAQRALDESRRAIGALSRTMEEPFTVVLADATAEVAARSGATLSLRLDPHVAVAGPVADALLRIACEAVANAAVHSGAEAVVLELCRDDRLRLRVSDEGSGFDPATVTQRRGARFGLVSMRERAAAVGAELKIRSAPGGGTTVEVAL
jgi:signal transduction histidine kinase